MDVTLKKGFDFISELKDEWKGYGCMKIKPKANRAPLALFDRIIYYILIILGCFSLALAYVFQWIIPMSIAFKDTNVIASRSNDFIVLFYLPVVVWVFFTLIFAPLILLKKRQPLFFSTKKSDIPSVYTVKVNPIFSSEFHKSLDKKDKLKIKKFALIYFSLLILSIAVLPFGFSPRNTLDYNDNLKVYNVFNRTTNTAVVSEAESVVLDIKLLSNGKNPSSVEIAQYFVFDDYTYEFNINSYYRTDTKNALTNMKRLKSLVAKDKCEIKHTERISRLISEKNYTLEEIALIYELFEY